MFCVLKKHEGFWGSEPPNWEYVVGYLTTPKELNTSSKIYHGGLAQQGERLHGMQEVSGSIPLVSTNT